MRGGRTMAAFVGCLLFGSGSLLAAGPAQGFFPPPSAPADPFFSATQDGSVLLAQVYASAHRGDEFVEIVNAGSWEFDLGGWSLSDGEGAAVFPPDTRLPVGGRIVATGNATSFAEDLLRPADFTWDEGPARRLEGSPLRLADSGDEALLLDPSGEVVDAFAYGESTYTGAGWSGLPAGPLGRGEVAIRGRSGDAFLDSDGREDWTGPREHRLGQSDFEPWPPSEPRAAYPFTSPERTREALLSFLGSARISIDVAVYTLTDEGIAASLAAAANSGVAVRVLLEGSPVGGVDPDAGQLAEGLAAAGAHVRLLNGAPDVVKRYRYLHAKYAILDGSSVWIGSENFGPSGFPTPGETGNRGWAVAIEDPLLAARLARVFGDDFDPVRRDSVPVDATAPPAEAPAPPTSIWPVRPPIPNVSASLVIGPDQALDRSGLVGLLEAARDTVWIELFYLEETWGVFPNPFLDGAIRAARRGATVRILLDGSWWNDDPATDGNDDVVTRLNALARREELPLEARLVEPRGPIERVHNKGVLVDGRTVFVGSMNWAHGSATANREVGVILESRELAATFEQALREDWGLATADDPFSIDDPAVLIALYGAVGAASVLSLRFLRGSPKGLKPRLGLRTRALLRDVLRRRHREVRLLPPHVVAEPEPRAGGGGGARGGGGEARGDRGGSEGD